MFEKLIVDADVCIKLGSSEKYCFLQLLLPCMSKKTYIHKCVYDEILIPASVKNQLNKLICDGFLEVIDVGNLSSDEKAIYDAVYSRLARVMMNPNKPRQNHGEVSSLAMAKTISIPVFFSDERDLQPIIDETMNTGLDDIVCVRIVDVVEKVRLGEIEGVSRKQAKAMWVMSGKDTGIFDNKIWPIIKS
jgi:hypothetical protein